MEMTLVLIKPEGMDKELIGEVLTMLKGNGLRIIGAKVVKVDKHLAQRHYWHLKDQFFFDKLVKHLSGEFHNNDGKILAFVYEGENAIQKVRDIVGATDPTEANPGTIRGKFGKKTMIDGNEVYENVVHASSSVEDAHNEIHLWFDYDELCK